jgi:hypothetical protein
MLIMNGPGDLDSGTIALEKKGHGLWKQRPKQPEITGFGLR